MSKTKKIEIVDRWKGEDTTKWIEDLGGFDSPLSEMNWFGTYSNFIQIKCPEFYKKNRDKYRKEWIGFEIKATQFEGNSDMYFLDTIIPIIYSCEKRKTVKGKNHQSAPKKMVPKRQPKLYEFLMHHTWAKYLAIPENLSSQEWSEFVNRAFSSIYDISKATDDSGDIGIDRDEFIYQIQLLKEICYLRIDNIKKEDKKRYMSRIFDIFGRNNKRELYEKCFTSDGWILTEEAPKHLPKAIIDTINYSFIPNLPNRVWKDISCIEKLLRNFYKSVCDELVKKKIIVKCSSMKCPKYFLYAKKAEKYCGEKCRKQQNNLKYRNINPEKKKRIY